MASPPSRVWWWVAKWRLSPSLIRASNRCQCCLIPRTDLQQGADDLPVIRPYLKIRGHMKVREIEFDMVAHLTERFGHDARTEGLHVSKIYGDLDKVLNAKRYSGSITPEALDHFAMLGFVWERILEETLADITMSGDPSRYFRPGEQVLDGVLATPDYADLDFAGDGSNVLGLEEWKVSWKSVNALDNLEKNFWRWIVQMKAYCHILQTTFARLRTLSIVGDWRDDISPKCRVFEFEFTELELAENWSMLTGHAKRKGWM